ncbi:unknown [Clostridium sp. CAG:575]|jgi:hypothetical protein|nr:unknown [Clostridium sp. CAG:575]
MTKEQEESLKKLRRQILAEKYTKNIGIPVYISDLKNVLSMLEEKDKEIDKLKKHNDDLLRKLRNRVKQVKKLEKYSLYKEEFSRLNKQLQNKDKIIDLMSEAINNNDIDEDICRRMGQKENCNEFEDKEKCTECIKQYFENKAKELLNK